MKLTAIILFALISVFAKANNPYRAYLFSKISYSSIVTHKQAEAKVQPKTDCVIPRFERPKGAVFCRMEDYLTVKTSVCIKIGVK